MVSRRVKVIVALVVLVALGGTALALTLTQSSITEVSVADVTRGDLTVSVSASGQVTADERVDLYPPTAGTLAAIEVTDGQAVRAGQVIAQLDTRPIEVQLAQARAAYSGALAQRDAAASAVPGDADRAAADAAVSGAQAAYDAAQAQVAAAEAGFGGPTAADIAEAQTAVAAATAASQAATTAYDEFYTGVYLPAPEPKDPALDAALAALALARDQAAANLTTAEQALAALLAASDSDAAVAAAEMARDQAYAAYLGAVAQREALAKASSVGSALDAADAAIAAAASARDIAESTLASATIVAPVDGIVIFNSPTASLLGSSGGGPTKGASVTPASAPFSIVTFDSLLFTAQVDEADIARIEPGMTAIVLLDALAEGEFATEVDRVEPQSVLTVTGGTAFPVRMRIANPDGAILLGMNGSVEIHVDVVGDAVTVPVEAVLEEGVTNYVYLVRDGRAIRQEVEVGRFTDTRAEILSGVSEGEQVVVSGVAELEDGARVKVR